MDTILIIGILVAAGVAVAIYFMKTGKIKDTDGDLIPDVIEDTVEEVKTRAKNVAKEAKEAKAAIKNAAKETKDVVKAVAGKSKKKMTKSKLRNMTKEELISLAKTDFDVQLDEALNKTNLINKVYELYNKK